MSERPRFVRDLRAQIEGAELRVARRRSLRRRALGGIVGVCAVVGGVLAAVNIGGGDDPSLTAGPGSSTSTRPDTPSTTLESAAPPATGDQPAWFEAETLIGGEALPGVFWTGSEVVVMRTENGGNEVVGERWDPSTNAATQIAASGLSWRVNSAMVWTGNEVLVVGGSSGPELNQVGAAYDPSADEWRPLADPPAEPGEAVMTGPGVWTGNEMIVWSAGLAYEPASDSWRSIAESPVSPQTRRPTTVWTGSELIVWGGCQLEGAICDEANEGLSSEGFRYDPATDMWTPLPDSPLAAAVHLVAGWTGTELLIVVTDPGDGPGVTAAAFDPATDNWRVIDEIPLSPRRFPASAWAGDRFVVWGGADPAGAGDERDGAIFDPETGQWTLLPEAPAPGRSLHTMVFAGDRLYSSATRWAASPLELRLPPQVTSSTPDSTDTATPTSVEITDLPDGYVQSARERFPSEATQIEADAAEVFGPRLGLVADASTEARAALRLFVVRAGADEIEAGTDMSTPNVDVVVSRALGRRDDFRDILLAIQAELQENGLGADVAIASAPLDQTITVGTPAEADPEVVDRVQALAREVVDRESRRIAEERPESIDIEVPWSVSVLRFDNSTFTDAEAEEPG